MCLFKGKVIKWTIIIMLLAFVSHVNGQLFPVSSQYMHNAIVINPAESGSEGALSLSLAYRNQWVGFDGSPKTYTASAHAPVKSDRVGLGIVVLSDHYGIFNHTIVRGNYAYRIELGRGVLAMGLAFSLTNQGVSMAKLIAEDADDDVLYGFGESTTKPNFGAGLLYSSQNYYLGFSIPELMSHHWRNDVDTHRNTSSDLKYDYFIYGGYHLQLHPQIALAPSIMTRYFNSNSLQFDITPQLIISDKIWLGVNYRTEGILSALLRCKIDDQLSAAYSYDFDLGDKRQYINGSHEVMLKYILKYKTQIALPR